MKKLLLTISSLALVACGDDSDSVGGNSSSAQSLPDIERSYIIDKDNAELVIKDVNLLTMLSNLNQPFDSDIDEQTGNINETADCAYGGTVKVSGNSR